MSNSLLHDKSHDDVIKWKHFPRNWPFVREIHRWAPHKGQWRGALMFTLIYAWINDWVNNREAGDLRRQHGHYDVIVMQSSRVYRVDELFLWKQLEIMISYLLNVEKILKLGTKISFRIGYNVIRFWATNKTNTDWVTINSLIRKRRDYIYGKCQYKLLNIRKLFESKSI